MAIDRADNSAALATGAGLFSMGVMGYERVAPTLGSFFLRASNRSRFFQQNYARADGLSAAARLFRSEASLLKSPGFGRLKIAAMVAGMATMVHGALSARERLLEGTSENRRQDRFFYVSGVFGGATIIASALFGGLPAIQFLTMVGGVAVDAIGLGISAVDAVRGNPGGGWGNFATQAAITYLFGWDRRSRAALSAAADRFFSGQVGPAFATAMVGGRSSVVRVERNDPVVPHTHLSTGGAAEIPPGAEGLPPEIVKAVMEKGGGDFSRPVHPFQTNKNISSERLAAIRADYDRQLRVVRPGGETVDLVEMPAGAVAAMSPKLLSSDRKIWVEGLRQVYDPRLDGTVVINTPGQVLRPRGIVVLFHGGSTLRSTPESWIEPGWWYNEQGFLVVSVAQPFHEYGPSSDRFLDLQHKMEWIQRIVDCAGDYYPGCRDLPRVLIGRSLGANDLLEYAVRYGSGSNRDPRVAAIHAISPYAPAWSDTCFAFLGEQSAAGINKVNKQGADSIRALDNQWTFCRPKSGHAEVDPFPGGSLETTFKADQLRAVMDRQTEGSRLVRKHLASLEAELAALEAVQPTITGSRRDEILATRDRLAAALRERIREITGVGDDAVLRAETIRERYLVRMAIARERLGYDVEEAWANHTHPISRELQFDPSGDPSPTALADVEIPLFITGGRLDQEYNSATPRHVEYWRALAGTNPNVTVVEYPFAYHNPWEWENQMTVASRYDYIGRLTALLDRSVPQDVAAAPLEYKVKAVARYKHQIGPDVPSNRVLEEMVVARGEQSEWAAKQLPRKKKIARDMVLWAKPGEGGPSEQMGLRDLTLWCDDVLTHEGRLMNGATPGMKGELRGILGISEMPSWEDESVVTLLRDLRRHLFLEPNDQFKVPREVPDGRGLTKTIETDIWDQFIHFLIDKRVSPLGNDDLIKGALGRLESAGLTLGSPPAEGQIPPGVLDQLLDIVPLSLIEERTDLHWKWNPRKADKAEKPAATGAPADKPAAPKES